MLAIFTIFLLPIASHADEVQPVGVDVYTLLYRYLVRCEQLGVPVDAFDPHFTSVDPQKVGSDSLLSVDSLSMLFDRESQIVELVHLNTKSTSKEDALRICAFLYAIDAALQEEALLELFGRGFMNTCVDTFAIFLNSSEENKMRRGDYEGYLLILEEQERILSAFSLSPSQ